MRARTGIDNSGGDNGVPEFHTDSNGLNMQKRSLVKQIGIEGNYYPVSTMTYLEDERAR